MVLYGSDAPVPQVGSPPGELVPISRWTRLIEAGTNRALSYFHRGLDFRESRQHADAIDDLTKAIELMPRSATPYRYRSFVHSQTGNYELAIADLNKFIGLDPKDFTAYLEQAWVYLYMDRGLGS